MTIADLREILNDPDLPPDAPVKVHITAEGQLLRMHWASTWEWTLEGAHATCAGPDRHLVLELYAPVYHPPPDHADPALASHLEQRGEEASS